MTKEEYNNLPIYDHKPTGEHLDLFRIHGMKIHPVDKEIAVWECNRPNDEWPFYKLKRVKIES